MTTIYCRPRSDKYGVTAIARVPDDRHKMPIELSVVCVNLRDATVLQGLLREPELCAQCPALADEPRLLFGFVDYRRDRCPDEHFEVRERPGCLVSVHFSLLVREEVHTLIVPVASQVPQRPGSPRSLSAQLERALVDADALRSEVDALRAELSAERAVAAKLRGTAAGQAARCASLLAALAEQAAHITELKRSRMSAGALPRRAKKARL